jgi:hypothetical protein
MLVEGDEQLQKVMSETDVISPLISFANRESATEVEKEVSEEEEEKGKKRKKDNEGKSVLASSHAVENLSLQNSILAVTALCSQIEENRKAAIEGKFVPVLQNLLESGNAGTLLFSNLFG